MCINDIIMQLYVYKLSFIHILPINILTARWLHEPFHITLFSLAMGSFDDFDVSPQIP